MKRVVILTLLATLFLVACTSTGKNVEKVIDKDSIAVADSSIMVLDTTVSHIGKQ